MDPLSVVRTIWRQKWFALPAIALAVGGAFFFYLEGPRSYESAAAYALANPQVPTDKEIEADPSLLNLNSNNPYLRSSDPNLVANVVITRLNATETAERLQEEGIDTEYTVSSGALGGGLVVSINASGATPEEAIGATTALGDLLQDYLYQVQKINGADDRFLFTSIIVSSPADPTEKISSRLRNVIMVGAAGVVLIFAAISLGTWVDKMRARPSRKGNEATEPDTEPEPEPQAEPESEPAATSTPPPHAAKDIERTDPAERPNRRTRNRSSEKTDASLTVR